MISVSCTIVLYCDILYYWTNGMDSSWKCHWACLSIFPNLSKGWIHDITYFSMFPTIGNLTEHLGPYFQIFPKLSLVAEIYTFRPVSMQYAWLDPIYWNWISCTITIHYIHSFHYIYTIWIGFLVFKSFIIML